MFYAPVLVAALAATQAAAMPASGISSAAMSRRDTGNPVSLDRSKFSITTTPGKTGSNPLMIIDGSAATAWTSNAGGCVQIAIDMKMPTVVGGLTYLVASAASAISDFKVEISSDGAHWSSVAHGMFPSGAATQRAYWTPQLTRYVRLSTLDAKSTVSAAEINLVGYFDYLPRTSWKVSADSVNPNPVFPPTYAIDGNRDTIWCSQWTDAQQHQIGSAADPKTFGAAGPHWFMIDQGKEVAAVGLSYMPRIGGLSRGNIGEYVVECSSDGKDWTPLASGTWVDDTTEKIATFGKSVYARYFRLRALSEAGGRGQWACIAEINLLTTAST